MSKYSVEYKVKVEQLKLLYQHTLNILIGASVVASIAVYALWGRLEEIYLLSWLLSIYLISIIRFIDWKWLWKNQVSQKSIQPRVVVLTVFSGISGVIWGLSGFFFLNIDDTNASLLVCMMLLGMVAASATSLSVLLPAYYAYAIPALTLIAYRSFTSDDGVFIMAGFLALLFLAINLIFARTSNRSITESIKLRFENVTLLEDLKKQKQLADTAREKAEHANAAKSKFLAAASHDLRQPLHALSLFVDAAKETTDITERANIFTRIDRSLAALQKLFDALLDLSRLDAKVVKPDYRHFNISTLFNILHEEFKAAANNKNLKFKIHCNDAIIISDRILLERVLRNLLSNAIRYTESGGILLSCRKRGDKLLLQVWDSGIGIAEKDQKKVFVEFQQLHNQHRDREQGLGLGLALVQRLCSLMQHELSLTSQLGRGSLFSLSVPEGDVELVAPKKTRKTNHRWSLDGRRILVVDDEQDILQAMYTLLKHWKCDVIIAESLTDAIDEMNHSGFIPELILSDLRLRDNQTGIDVIDHLKNIYGQSIAGILITGDTDPDRIKLVKQSDYELLQKPVRPAHLRSIIQHNLPMV